MTTTLHAHVATTSRDCDSTYSREYVATLSEKEIAEHVEADGINDFHDIHFKNRLMGDIASPYAVRQMTVSVTEHGFDAVEYTEEGFRQSEVRWCEDECDEAMSSYRDSTAEAMGY